MAPITPEMLRRRISQFTNSQNEISIRDMNSDHDQQKSIQENIKNNYDGFFWERKSGERKLHEPDPSWYREHNPQTLRIIDNLKVAKTSYAYHYEKPFEAVMLKESVIFDERDKTFKDIFEMPVKEFIISWILDKILDKSITHLKNSGTNSVKLVSHIKSYEYEYESVVDLVNSHYAKRTCLALFHYFLEKNQKSDDIENAIIKFMSFSTQNNGKFLNKAGGIKEQQIEHIVPIFLCIMQFFDIDFRQMHYNGKSLSSPDIEAKDIKSHFEDKDAYGDILGKIIAHDKTLDGKITTILDASFDNLIAEANNLTNTQRWIPST